MSDETTELIDILEKIIKATDDLDGKKVVHESQQLGPAKNKILSLQDRLSSTQAGAQTRQMLEAVQQGQAAPEDASTDEMIEMWADDILNKTLDEIFGE